jgi:hypothetical protein
MTAEFPCIAVHDLGTQASGERSLEHKLEAHAVSILLVRAC